jgi:hypothetical protein
MPLHWGQVPSDPRQTLTEWSVVKQMNQYGPEFLDRLWLVEAALDALAAFGLPNWFLSLDPRARGLSPLRLRSGGARQLRGRVESFAVGEGVSVHVLPVAHRGSLSGYGNALRL